VTGKTRGFSGARGSAGIGKVLFLIVGREKITTSSLVDRVEKLIGNT